MAEPKKCKRCEGWALERDPGAIDGWARDENKNAIPCRDCGATGKQRG